MRIELLERKTEELFELVNSLPENETKSRMAEYLCIRASGLLESIIKQLVSDYISNGTPQEVQSYVNTKLRTLTNLEHEKIKQFLSTFSQDWCNEYSSRVTEEQAASINSIYGIRNSLAHGGPSTISFRQMSSHYTNLKDVINCLKTIISRSSRSIRSRGYQS